MRYLILLTVFFTLSCGSKPKYIPDKELGEIIMHSVIANNFVMNTGVRHLLHDSLSIYLPILDERGYTIEDVNYTIDRMLGRKSNVFTQLLDDVANDVRKLKEKYEYEGDMRRNWKKLVTENVVDTLYYSADTIKIKSEDDLRMLNYKVHINETGEYIVKYNYMVGTDDSNSSRYMVYELQDSTTGKHIRRSNFWLAKSAKESKFERVIRVTDTRRCNTLDFRILSFNTKGDEVTSKEIKEVDFTASDVTILFKPDYEVANYRYEKEVFVNLPILWDFNYKTEKQEINFMIPYDTIYGARNINFLDSVRYHKEIPYSHNTNLLKEWEKRQKVKK